VRILFVSHDSSLYGAQRSLLDLVKRLPRARFSAIVALPYGGQLGSALERDGIRVCIVPFGLWIPTRAIWRPHYFWGYPRRCLSGVFHLADVIRREKVDLVYSNTVTVIEGALAARARRVPHIWHLREGIEGNGQLVSLVGSRTAYRVARRLSRAVIFNSFALRRSYGPSAEGTGVVIHNGIEPGTSAYPEIPTKAESVDRLPVILVAGYMDERKGLDVLLDAARILIEQGRQFEIRVAGVVADSYRAREIAPRMDNADLARRVTWLGWIDDMREQYRGADILVSSSRQEPFGRSLIEAMDSRLPVVATRAGGPEEIVKDGVTGLLVPTDDPGALAEALLKLLDDSPLAARMGYHGQQRVRTLFPIDETVRRVISTVESVMDGRGPRSPVS